MSMAQIVKYEIVHTAPDQKMISDRHPTSEELLCRIADALEYLAMAESVKLKDYGIPPFVKK